MPVVHAAHAPADPRDADTEVLVVTWITVGATGAAHCIGSILDGADGFEDRLKQTTNIFKAICICTRLAQSGLPVADGYWWLASSSVYGGSLEYSRELMLVETGIVILYGQKQTNRVQCGPNSTKRSEKSIHNLDGAIFDVTHKNDEWTRYGYTNTTCILCGDVEYSIFQNTSLILKKNNAAHCCIYNKRCASIYTYKHAARGVGPLVRRRIHEECDNPA